MLRNRSKAVTTKQTLMADHSSQASPVQNCTKPIPSFFVSPRFKAFTSKAFLNTDFLKSPTSILENKPFFPFANLFVLDKNHPKSFFFSLLLLFLLLLFLFFFFFFFFSSYYTA
uniref:Uncharacterized protein n=1 Tax=Gossypium raimondii TaxID=29730 RepID=A0A0D2RYI1_GOSRA|nr:hypothetical protein B456_012G060900 [Gossypium raimondii]